jgi:DNA-3-methyladenine glycosylase
MDFIGLSTIEIAKELLGKKLLIQCEGKLMGGYIVETEAYLGPEDMTCHSYLWKRTPKVAAMYEGGGTIYICSMHGHNMLNIVTKEAGQPDLPWLTMIKSSK